MTMNLNELPRGGTMCLAKAGLGIGGSDTATLSIAAPNGAGVDFMIKGILYHKADAADALAFTAGTAQGLLSKCIYLVCIDKDGTVSTVQGDSVLTADLAAGAATLEWPTPTADTCCIGAVKVQTLLAVNFTAATTDLDATSIADTYYDLFCVPVAPLTS